jgi:hypothetical protein
MHQGASRAALGAVLAAALLLPASRGPVSVPPSQPFDGTAAVSALFTVGAGGRLAGTSARRAWCTAATATWS